MRIGIKTHCLLLLAALATAATGKDGEKRGLSKLGKQFCERVYAAGGIVDV